MKLETNIKTQGVFAIGNESKHSIAGSLEINELGVITLNGIHNLGLPNRGHINLIGETSELGKVLLLDCFTNSASYNFSCELAREEFLCNKLVCVEKEHQGYEIKTNKMTFEIEDLEIWIATPILKDEIDNGNMKHTYILPKNERIVLDENLDLVFTYNLNFSKGNFYEYSEVHSKAFAVFESKKEMELDYFIKKGFELSNLISFSLDTVSTIKNSFYGENQNNKVFYPTVNSTKKRKKINLVNHLFTLRSAGERRIKIINNWFLISEKIRPTISLYNQYKSKKYDYADAAFLSLSQAAEALHRRTSDEKPMPTDEYSEKIRKIIERAGEEHKDFLDRNLSSRNEYSFRMRLELMLETLWSKEKIDEEKKKITAIINARNFLTHYPKSRERKFYCKFDNEVSMHIFILENIIISNILYLLSKDKNWVMNIIKNINITKPFDF
ncbi:HEPN domain-containing protein [Rosenbergiella epipactidis]|uniref:ApeA N-terminal domain 1-containing protein n=1 Tax=Rosenbergiella epipactidis TaxID=1544694 RepID=UPI001F4E5794